MASPSYPVCARYQCSAACHRGHEAPHLVVSGYAEQKAEPDMLTLNVAVTALEKQGIKAKQQVDTKVAAFFGQLENLGIKRSDVEAGNLVISPNTSTRRTSSPRWWVTEPSASWPSNSTSSTS